MTIQISDVMGIMRDIVDILGEILMNTAILGIDAIHIILVSIPRSIEYSNNKRMKLL